MKKRVVVFVFESAVKIGQKVVRDIPVSVQRSPEPGSNLLVSNVLSRLLLLQVVAG
jgi:predicted aspartyl protease